MKCVYIDDSKYPFTSWIFLHQKKMETRSRNTLKNCLHEPVGILQTGKGKTILVGWCEFDDPIVFHNEKEFRDMQYQHKVLKGSEYDIKPDGIKYGYPIVYAERFYHPYEIEILERHGRVWVEANIKIEKENENGLE